MSKKNIFVLMVCMVFSLNACMLSRTIIFDSSPPAEAWSPDFETGLIFKAPQQKSLAIWEGPQVIIREFLTREIVFNDEVDWHCNTSIPLVPGKYIVDLHAKYLGIKIWKYKGFFEVNETAPTHLMFDTPLLVTSKPRVVFR